MKNFNFNIWFLIFLTASLLTCCKKDAEKDIPIKENELKFLWSVGLQGNNDINKFIDIEDDVYYDNGIVVSYFEDGKRGLSMIDLETKEIRWKWFEDIPLAFQIDKQYQFNNFLVVAVQYNVYCIDLKTGKIVFKQTKNNLFDNWVTGIGNTFFLSSYNYGGDADLYKGDIRTGQITKYLSPNYKRTGVVNGAITRIIYKSNCFKIQNDSLLFLPFIEPRKESYNFPQLGIYKMNENKWSHSNIDIVWDSTFYKTMINGVRIHENKVYIACGNDLVCYDIYSAKEIWRRNDFYHYFAFASHGFEIFDNKLVASTLEGKTYCIDINSGKNIWVIDKVGGSNSFIHYHNGVLYYIAGGVLRCVDIQTGQTLAKVTSPDKDILQYRVVVIPQKNNEKPKVVIFSHKNMFVYEAIR